MENYSRYNSRNIFEYLTPTRALFLCIDALDFKDGKGAPAPKMKVRCCVYDDAQERGERITDEVDAYIPLGTFLVLTHDVLSGVLVKRKQQAGRNGDRQGGYFSHYGGAKGPPTVSTRLSVVDGSGPASAFAILASSGPGKMSKTGGIIPVGADEAQKNGFLAPAKRIYINLPDNKLKELCLLGKAYAEQFIALDLQCRLDEVRRQRAAFREKQESAYVSSYGYGGPPHAD